MSRVDLPLFIRERQWVTGYVRSRHSRAHPLSPTHVGSLTAQLRQHCPNFQVRIVFEGPQRASHDECLPLALPRSARVWARDVLLCDGQQPHIFAHSIIPMAGMARSRLWLQSLGTQPLGELLFAQPNIPRSPLSYLKLSRHHPLLVPLRNWPLRFPLTARRSVFWYRAMPLLVTEVFLDGHIPANFYLSCIPSKYL